eukprot:scaffold51684_cov72-Phaeocystis_antarctica.AAC.8
MAVSHKCHRTLCGSLTAHALGRAQASRHETHRTRSTRVSAVPLLRLLAISASARLLQPA